MTILSARSSGSFESHRDVYLSIPATTETPQGPGHELQPLQIENHGSDVPPSWSSLFAFTTKEHSAPLSVALITTFFSALLKPTAAIFFGKIFDVLIKFGLGQLDGHDTLHGVSLWCVALVSLGGIALLVETVFFSSWLIFGELQAKSLREKMFIGMLDKEMEWYDVREDGMGSLLIRIQT